MEIENNEEQKQEFDSTDDIAAKAMAGVEQLTPVADMSDDLPIGDIPDAQEQDQAMIQEDFRELIERDKQEIESVEYTDTDNPKTKNQFQLLKEAQQARLDRDAEVLEASRDENRALREENERLRNQHQLNSEQKIQELNGTVEEWKQKYEVKAQLAEENRVFRLMMDAKSDPIVQRDYINPMARHSEAAKKTIRHVLGEDSTLWQDILDAKGSIPLINDLIDSSGISGLNATALRDHAKHYSEVKEAFDHITSPEHVEATLNQSRGIAKAVDSAKITKAFTKSKQGFSMIAKDFAESEVNKDQNEFVADRIDDNADKYYKALVDAIKPEYLHEGALTTLSDIAYRAAGFPYANHAYKFEKEHRAKLAKKQKAKKKAPKVTQTKEVSGTSLNNLSIKEIGSADDIARRYS